MLTAGTLTIVVPSYEKTPSCLFGPCREAWIYRGETVIRQVRYIRPVGLKLSVRWHYMVGGYIVLHL